jgi:hypothetical protein
MSDAPSQTVYFFNRRPISCERRSYAQTGAILTDCVRKIYFRTIRIMSDH